MPIRLFLQLRDGGEFESVADQLVNNAQLILRSLKAFHGGNGLFLLSVNILLHIGNLGFQMPYSYDFIVPHRAFVSYPQIIKPLYR